MFWACVDGRCHRFLNSTMEGSCAHMDVVVVVEFCPIHMQEHATSFESCKSRELIPVDGPISQGKQCATVYVSVSLDRVIYFSANSHREEVRDVRLVDRDLNLRAAHGCAHRL